MQSPKTPGNKTSRQQQHVLASPKSATRRSSTRSTRTKQHPQQEKDVADFVSEDRERRRLADLDKDNAFQEEELILEKKDTEYIFQLSDDDDSKPIGKKTRKNSTVQAVKKRKLDKGNKFKKRKLEQILEDDDTPGGAKNELDTATPSYYNNAAQPSVLPRRFFCSMCGFIAPYCCTRCKQRFCNIACQDQHKETKCFKY